MEKKTRQAKEQEFLGFLREHGNLNERQIADAQKMSVSGVCIRMNKLLNENKVSCSKVKNQQTGKTELVWNVVDKPQQFLGVPGPAFLSDIKPTCTHQTENVVDGSKNSTPPEKGNIETIMDALDAACDLAHETDGKDYARLQRIGKLMAELAGFLFYEAKVTE